MQGFLLHWIEYFSESVYLFSQIREMNITTISSKRYMTYENYFENLCNWLNWSWKIFFNISQLINALDKSVDLPLNKREQ